jgi:hypothetical protein
LEELGALDQVVRSGKPAVSDIFAYFREHPQETENFDAGMKSKAQSVVTVCPTNLVWGAKLKMAKPLYAGTVARVIESRLPTAS